MIKVVTFNGGVMELYAPVTVECITNGFPVEGLVAVGVPSSCAECLAAALRKDPEGVVLIDSIDRAYPNFINNLAKSIKTGTFDDPVGRKVSLAHGIFILITADPTNLDSPDEEPENVIDLKLHVEKASACVASSTELKRKPEEELLPNKLKKHRTGESGLDLNIRAKEEEEERDEEEDMSGRDHHHHHHHLPLELLESMVACFVLEVSPTRPRRMAESFASKLRRSLEAAWGVRDGSRWLSIDEAVVDELTKASGSFVESLFEKQLKEVFETSLLMVKNGGKLRLYVAGEAGSASEFGFRGSVLPTRPRRRASMSSSKASSRSLSEEEEEAALGEEDRRGDQRGSRFAGFNGSLVLKSTSPLSILK